MKYVMMLLASLSFNAFAHDVYQGTIKGTTRPCTLEVDQVYYENNVETPANLRADIVISFEDAHHHKMMGVSHGEELFFTVKPSANPLVLNGLAQNKQDQVNLFTADGTLKTLSMYAVKWLHGNHFHSAQCVNLQYVAH